MGEVDPQSSLSEQLAGFAARMRPRLIERLERLQRLSESDGADAGEIAAGRVEAHKLRGLLGTIGLPEGSERAAEIEGLLEQGSTEIAEPLARLRALVDSG